jgi:ComF family protein
MMKSIDSMARLLVSRFLDVLYPPACELCGVVLRDGRSLCNDCDAGLPRLAEPFCGHCGQPFSGKTEGSRICPNCDDRHLGFNFARPVLLRTDETMSMVHALKYGRQRYLGRELGRLVAEAFDDPRLEPALDGRWPVIPVPLHRARQRHRHFNQAEEIAREMARHTGHPVCLALRRVRATPTQTTLHRKERFDNLRDAFELTRAGRRLLASRPAGAVVVDDVLTTGSTLGTCARLLRDAGIPVVVAIALVRG